MLNGNDPLYAETSEFRRCIRNPASDYKRYRFAACLLRQRACGADYFHGNFFYRVIALFCYC
jgi:hypothetical protein